MAVIDVAQRLERWVELNLQSREHMECGAEMHDQAKACAEGARGSPSQNGPAPLPRGRTVRAAPAAASVLTGSPWACSERVGSSGSELVPDGSVDIHPGS